MDGLQRYKGGKDRATLRNYISRRVKGTIVDYQRGEDYMTRGTRQKFNKIRAARNELEKKGLPTGMSEICEKIGMKPKDYHYVVCLENIWGGNIEYDTTNELNIGPASFSKTTDLKALEKALDILSDDERILVKLRFIDELNLKEIGEYLGLGEASASLKMTKIILKMKGALKIK